MQLVAWLCQPSHWGKLWHSAHCPQVSASFWKYELTYVVISLSFNKHLRNWNAYQQMIEQRRCGRDRQEGDEAMYGKPCSQLGPLLESLQLMPALQLFLQIFKI